MGYLDKTLLINEDCIVHDKLFTKLSNFLYLNNFI